MTDLQKPLRRKVRPRTMPHGYRPELVVTLHPGGMVELREVRSRREPVSLDLATLYVKARIQEAHDQYHAGGGRRRRGKR
jgi:hypothetical protein